MSANDDIKAELADISAKVDRLITGIPERHFQYLNKPDESAAKIDELQAQVAETGDIKAGIDALKAKLDAALAGQRERYVPVEGDASAAANVAKPVPLQGLPGKSLPTGVTPKTDAAGNSVNPNPAIPDTAIHIGQIGPDMPQDDGNNLEPNAVGSFGTKRDMLSDPNQAVST